VDLSRPRSSGWLPPGGHRPARNPLARVTPASRGGCGPRFGLAGAEHGQLAVLQCQPVNLMERQEAVRPPPSPGSEASRRGAPNRLLKLLIRQPVRRGCGPRAGRAWPPPTACFLASLPRSDFTRSASQAPATSLKRDSCPQARPRTGLDISIRQSIPANTGRHQLAACRSTWFNFLNSEQETGAWILKRSRHPQPDVPPTGSF